jgi:hypothetical protein
VVDLLHDSLSKFGDRLVPMLGVTMGVSIRLKVLPKQKDADQELLKDKYAREQKDRMIKVFVERVLGAKNPLPRRVYVRPPAFDRSWKPN